VSEAILLAWRAAWRPRLTNLKGDLEPEARAAVGRALGSLTVQGVFLDNHTGVSVRHDGTTGLWLPDIDWMAVPGGRNVGWADEGSPTNQARCKLFAVRYRRASTSGGTFFFTVVTFARRPLFDARGVELLRQALREVKRRHPFQMEAVVVLPDHLHTIWTSPPNDSDFSTRWMLIFGL